MRLDLVAKIKLMRLVGITSTVPIEIMVAGGAVPVDLNNVFITHPRRDRLISEAEGFGFPANFCSWVKGIFQVAREMGIKEVVGVTRGDCSGTEKLLEVYELLGIKKIPFSYPVERKAKELKKEMERFAGYFGTDLKEGGLVRRRLVGIRRKLARLDELTWREGLVSGYENHYWLVSASDFNRDIGGFGKELDNFLEGVKKRKKGRGGIRIAYLGVPSVFDDLYEVLEELGAVVVYNEVQREFAMVKGGRNLIEQYLNYTYPYDIFYRVKEISKELKQRRVQAIIHYGQTFCHRQIEGMIFKKVFNLPVLSIEGDKPGALEARLRTRLEAFLEMIKGG